MAAEEEEYGFDYLRATCGQNLAAVINDPTQKFHPSEWPFPPGESIPPSPHRLAINEGAFRAYLEQNSAPFQTFVANHAGGQDLHLVGDSLSSGAVIGYLKEAQAVVNEVFFEPSFDLNDASTFDAIISAKHARTHLLQEKLSHFLAIVEEQLAKSIAMQSQAFFGALSHIRELHFEVQQSVAHIHALRRRMNNVDALLSTSALSVSAIHRRRTNLIKLYTLVKQIATVRQTQPTIQLLLSINDYSGALDLIEDTQRVLREDLGDIRALRHLSTQLAGMTEVIGKMMEAEFICLVAPEDGDPPSLEDAREGLCSVVLGMARVEQLKGLADAYKGRVDKAMNAAARTSLTVTLGEVRTMQDDTSPARVRATDTLTEQLRNLEAKDFARVLDVLLNDLLAVLYRAKEVTDGLNSILDDAVARGTFRGDFKKMEAVDHDDANTVLNASLKRAQLAELKESEGDGHESDSSVDSLRIPRAGPVEATEEDKARAQDLAATMRANLGAMLAGVCETANFRAKKVLETRADRHEKLRLEEFVNMAKVLVGFVLTSEELCGQQCLSLRTALGVQAKTFLDHFHQNRLSTLAMLLENERWVPAQVPVEIQHIADEMAGLDVDLSVDPEGMNERVFVRGVGFKPVGCTVMLLKIIAEYLHCGSQLSGLVAAIVRNLTELLNLFNDRTCKLILGAGAMQMAGLKSISAKHLGLAAQSLALLEALVPFVHKSLQGQLPEKQHPLLNDLDRVLKDINTHKGDVFTKIFRIMAERSTAHAKRIEAVPWSTPEAASVPHSYMKDLVKETMILHKILVDLIDPADLQRIFAKVFVFCEKTLRSQYERTELASELAQQRLLADITYFASKLGSLRKLESLSPGTSLNEYWQRRFGGNAPT